MLKRAQGLLLKIKPRTTHPSFFETLAVSSKAFKDASTKQRVTMNGGAKKKVHINGNFSPFVLIITVPRFFANFKTPVEMSIPYSIFKASANLSVLTPISRNDSLKFWNKESMQAFSSLKADFPKGF
jgi:hypothetical protein